MVPRNAVLQILKRVLGRARGRPLAGVLLLLLLVLNGLSELPPDATRQATWWGNAVQAVTSPFAAARTWVFDNYQALVPRERRSQPVTIVAIDEKSLAAVGQWPWPRDQMAQLIDAINQHQPAAIGLDIYMPEADQTSPSLLAQRIASTQPELAAELRALPTNETILANALREAPSVLGAAGFDFDAYTTSAGLRTAPLFTHGADPMPHVRKFSHVLASMPELQAASSGQALLSVDVQDSAVRRIPLLAAVGDALVPGLAMEMLRVATNSFAVEVHTGERGIEAVGVADLLVPTQPRGDVWLHTARMDNGIDRYVSAYDVMQDHVDPAMLSGKLVLIGLTGAGLMDMRSTALGELVPGIEIQAQLIEALFDGHVLLRPWWMKWFETLLLAAIGLSLIWFVPRTDSRLAALMKNQPQVSMGITLALGFGVLALGFAVFQFRGLLFDAAAVVIVFSLVMTVLISSALIEGLGEARTRLSRLVENGIALGREQNRDKLLRQTLQSARELANCEAAMLFLKTEHSTLRMATSLGMAQSAADTPEIPLYDEQGNTHENWVAAYVVHHGNTLLIDDVAQEVRFDTRGLKAGQNPVVSLLNVPMVPGEGKVIGMIQLVNALDRHSGEPIAFDRKLTGFMEALAAQAAVAIENQSLVEAQKALLDSMIQIMAGAIDTKSPYTGGHCERVPELAMLLAQEACDAKDGPLAPFTFRTEDEWREFRIGAWLHDCGKVTTPEYVVDKATKLETIFNRIHEIRTRFEVLLRDAQVQRLEAIHEQGVPASEANAAFEARRAELIDDFAFVAECNLGGEFMAPDKVERLQRIAQNTWLRHFDDRLGLSHDELERHEREPAQPLPVREQLLADKAYHLFERPPNKALDEKHGFKLKVPEYLYNHGELHNLAVARGTLTDEERFKINEHIIQTIVMLEQMPLPANLRRVPEYAGTHHETLIGSGYPRKLTEAELSVPSRIMAIADIFEALTASDRPYKKAKTLSESIKILSFFKKDKHVDPVLFDLFLTSGVYKTYAERYLKPEQIDEVDIAQYLG
jgi:HD-GYP domain-containing protein (c-di-GMP phosphodiesterase class II)/CHASE2 domain-containing sensor protein